MYHVAGCRFIADEVDDLEDKVAFRRRGKWNAFLAGFRIGWKFGTVLAADRIMCTDSESWRKVYFGNASMEFFFFPRSLRFNDPCTLTQFFKRNSLQWNGTSQNTFARMRFLQYELIRDSEDQNRICVGWFSYPFLFQSSRCTSNIGSRRELTVCCIFR